MDSTVCEDSPAPLGWMPPRHGWALLAVAVVAHPLQPVVFRHPWVGVAVAVLGLWMAVAAKRRFRRLGLPMSPTARPTGLLTDGWFGLSRNPMYVGIALVLFGAGLVLGSWAGLLSPLAYLAIIRRWFVPGEEERLASVHGDEWGCYARRVPRWL